MSKDDQLETLLRAIRAENRKMDAEFGRYMDVAVYVERSALIVLGVTVTVLAGFLSQVWGSAGVAFRTELAEILQRSGNLFTTAFILPFFRHLMHDNLIRYRWRSIAYFVVWSLVLLFIYLRFSVLLHEAGETIVKYAKIANPG